jgi:transglutaminase-like putative cysteine protease
MLYRISHGTRYSYSKPVLLCHNLGHLTPRSTSIQHCRESRIIVHPVPAVSVIRSDFFGNLATYFSIQESHRELRITAEHLVEVLQPVPPDPLMTTPWEIVRDQLVRDLSTTTLDAYQYIFDSPYIPQSQALLDFALPSFKTNRPILDAVLDLNNRIYSEFKYDPQATTVATPINDVLKLRRGVCQDFAHLMIGCIRSMGLAARYVSGYLRTLPPEGKPRLIGADASHAWISVFIAGFGWIDVDPTNDTLVRDQHILLAWGRDFEDVSPIKGVILGGGSHSVHVSVDVEAVEAESTQRSVPTTIESGEDEENYPAGSGQTQQIWQSQGMM